MIKDENLDADQHNENHTKDFMIKNIDIIENFSTSRDPQNKSLKNAKYSKTLLDSGSKMISNEQYPNNFNNSENSSMSSGMLSQSSLSRINKGRGMSEQHAINDYNTFREDIYKLQ